MTQRLVYCVLCYNNPGNAYAAVFIECYLLFLWLYTQDDPASSYYYIFSFRGETILISPEAAQTYIPITNTWVLPFLPGICCFCLCVFLVIVSIKGWYGIWMEFCISLMALFVIHAVTGRLNSFWKGLLTSLAILLSGLLIILCLVLWVICIGFIFIFSRMNS